jgi:hypothetical protein
MSVDVVFFFDNTSLAYNMIYFVVVLPCKLGNCFE